MDLASTPGREVAAGWRGGGGSICLSPTHTSRNRFARARLHTHTQRSRSTCVHARNLTCGYTDTHTEAISKVAAVCMYGGGVRGGGLVGDGAAAAVAVVVAAVGSRDQK